MHLNALFGLFIANKNLLILCTIKIPMWVATTFASLFYRHFEYRVHKSSTHPRQFAQKHRLVNTKQFPQNRFAH